MFSMLPVDRSSRMKTSWFFFSRASARCDPKNPAPPVIKTRALDPLSNEGRFPFEFGIYSPRTRKEYSNRFRRPQRDPARINPASLERYGFDPCQTRVL